MRQGFGVWLTGTPASGKSRRARALKSLLDQEGVPVQRLESDELRKVLTPHPTYSAEERVVLCRHAVYRQDAGR